MDDFINSPASNVLAFDPSQNYTGWVLYKPHNNRIIDYECIRKDEILDGREFSGVMDQRIAFEMEYAKSLKNIMKTLDPETTHVAIEEPTGSQSARAAWALAMSSQGVIATTICVLGIEPITYKERDAKMHMFGTDVVPKEKTKKVMWSYWKSNNIDDPDTKFNREHRKTELRKMKEAVADAMLILNLHLHKLSTNEHS